MAFYIQESLNFFRDRSKANQEPAPSARTFKKIEDRFRFGTRTVPILVFLVLVVLYTHTMNLNFIVYSAGGVSDAADFILGANYLGIVHPPGYPLYLLLGKAAITTIPFGSIGFRLSCLSALCASLTVLLVYAILLRRTRNAVIAIAAALALAFSRTFWSQAVIQEVYALHALLGTLTLFFLLLWKDTKKPSFLVLAFFSLGLSFTNHLTTALMLPGILYFIWKEKITLHLIGSFLIGLSVYLYLPFRIQTTPYINPMVFQLGIPLGSLKWYIWYLTAHDFWGFMWRFSLTSMCIGAAFMIFSVIMWRRLDSFFKFCLITLLLNILYFLNYNVFDRSVFFLFSFAIGALLLGDAAARLSSGGYLKKLAPSLLVIPIFLLFQNYSYIIQGKHNNDYFIGKESLGGIDKDAIYISWYTFPILQYKYYQMVEELRKDISFYSIEGAPPDEMTHPEIKKALVTAGTRREVFDLQVSAWANIINGWFRDPSFNRPIYFVPSKNGIPPWLIELCKVEPVKDAAGTETGIFRLRRR